jgi:hypothetical protein
VCGVGGHLGGHGDDVEEAGDAVAVAGGQLGVESSKPTRWKRAKSGPARAAARRSRRAWRRWRARAWRSRARAWAATLAAALCCSCARLRECALRCARLCSWSLVLTPVFDAPETSVAEWVADAVCMLVDILVCLITVFGLANNRLPINQSHT